MLSYEVFSQYFGHRAGPATSLKVRFAGDLFERPIPLRDKYFVTLAIDGPYPESSVRPSLSRLYAKIEGCESAIFLATIRRFILATNCTALIAGAGILCPRLTRKVRNTRD